MAPKKRSRAKADPALAELREKIREAEKAQAPVARELVALDKAAYERLAVLVQRGIGKKPGVLAQALALGLEALTNTSAAPTEYAAPHAASPPNVVDLFGKRAPAEEEDADAEEDASASSSLAATALGGSFAFDFKPAGNAVPPSQLRRESADPDGEEDADDGT